MSEYPRRKVLNRYKAILANVDSSNQALVEQHLQEKCKKLQRQREYDTLIQQIDSCVKGGDIHDKIRDYYFILIGNKVLAKLKEQPQITEDTIKAI